MTAYLLPIPVMLILSVLQSTAVSRINLLNGSADLILLAVAAWGVRERGYDAFIWALVGGLFIAVITAMPPYLPILSYAFVALLSRLLFGRIWQSPIVMLILTVFLGTLFQDVLSLLYLQISGIDVAWVTAMRNFFLTGLLLNLFLCIPMYAVMSDLRKTVKPEENYE